jgi:hypothetical protein
MMASHCEEIWTRSVSVSKKISRIRWRDFWSEYEVSGGNLVSRIEYRNTIYISIFIIIVNGKQRTRGH